MRKAPRAPFERVSAQSDPLTRHCEERSDGAIKCDAAVVDCFAFGSQ